VAVTATPRSVEHLRAHLEHMLRAVARPPHLLRLDHPAADHLIHGRFRRRRRNRHPGAISNGVVGERVPIPMQVPTQIDEATSELPNRERRLRAFRLRPAVDLLEEFPGSPPVSVPQMPFRALEGLDHPAAHVGRIDGKTLGGLR